MPLVLVVVVGTAPIAREICELSCEEHPASGSATHDHDQGMMGHEMRDGAMSVPQTGGGQPNAGYIQPPGQSHGEGEPSCNLSVSPGPQACGHDHESQAESAPPTPLPMQSPAIVAHVQGLVSPNLQTAPFADGTARSLASIPIALRTPLRV